MQTDRIHLKVLLPFRVYEDRSDVSRLVAETRDGSFGILAHRLDCIAALTPGILTYSTDSDDKTYIAVDEGVLVKTGLDVLVSVRRAMGGKDLRQLRAALEKEFLSLNDQEQQSRAAMAKLETGILRRLGALAND